ncbi:hypothetical protein ACFRCG_41930 [Embleya sp. NPDC056575]|uniref:hypothetical protein n=1 Tax=unclassified Embleya TaxID=2699296 RepID=UPI00367FE494
MPSAEMVTAISGLVVGLGGISGTVAVARAGRRTPGQERRDDFTAITNSLQTQLDGVKEELGEQKAEATLLKEGRRQDSRTINALVRYLRATLRTLREHDIPPPVPDPNDALELSTHGLP